MNKLIASLIMVSALSGCKYFGQTPEEIHFVPAVPYTFNLATYSDERDASEARKMIGESYDVKINDIAPKLTKLINVSLFSANNAYLNVKLLDFATARVDDKYLLSMYLDVTGYDHAGHLLAEGEYVCKVDEKEGIELVEMAEQAIKLKNVSHRHIQTWDEMVNNCLKIIARDFNKDVIVTLNNSR